MNTEQLYSLAGKVAVVTGAGGVLGGAIARGLARAGARVAIVDCREEHAVAAANTVVAKGGTALPYVADVLDRAQLEAAAKSIVVAWGGIQILFNVAGGNQAAATVDGEVTFFNLCNDALEQVLRLNLLGSIAPSQVFGQVMAQGGCGSIVNISSMAAQKPLTRTIGYSAAKAAIDNFTKWLAVELAYKHGASMRVNAIAPGFFVGDQNRALLLNEDGTLTERSRHIIDHTPMGRFGEPDDLVGTAVWLASDAARFVTGVVVPVDGGFSACCGV